MKKLFLMLLGMLCVILGAMKAFTDMTTQNFAYTAVAIVSLSMAGYIGYYFMWYQKLSKKLNELAPLLSTKPDRYITGMNDLLNNKYEPHIEAIFLMNLACAYWVKKDFPAAERELLKVSQPALKKDNVIIYQLNLAYTYINQGKTAEADAILAKEEKTFLALPMGGNLPMLNAFVQIYQLIKQENWKEARKQVTSAKEKWGMDIPGIDYTVLEDYILENMPKKHKSSRRRSEATPLLSGEAVDTTEDEEPGEETSQTASVEE